jgi:putative nucleotidyltransferase with HDIG domain
VGALKRFLYRIRQYRHAVSARPTDDDLEEVSVWLTPSQRMLFSQLPPSDQMHAIEVTRKLLLQGETHPELLAAALLHDVGKSRYPLQPWERAAIVVGQKLSPRLLENLLRSRATHRLRRLHTVAAQHPAWGAEMARQAGVSPLAEALIRRHQDPLEDPISDHLSQEDCLLIKLQAVDDET